MLNKKILLAALTASTSPSFTVVKFSNLNSHYKIMVHYNGQADLLLSLQIYPDYYPYQFKQQKLYDYLTHIDQYIVENEHTSESKKGFGAKMKSKLSQLISQIRDFGPSLWNEDLYEGGLVYRNNQFWSTKSSDYLFLEQFVLDDYADNLLALSKLPKHKKLITTNFRASRDPYTIFDPAIFKYFEKLDLKNNTNTQNEINGANLASKLYEYYRSYSKLKSNSLFRAVKYMQFWNSFCSVLQSSLKSKVEKDDKNGINLLNLAQPSERLFSISNTSDLDKQIAQKFSSMVFSEEESKLLKEWNGPTDFMISYLRNRVSREGRMGEESLCSYKTSDSKVNGFVKAHHPALEHTIIPGSSPVFEGTQKDIKIYLTQMGISLDLMSKDPRFQTTFAGDNRKEKIEKSVENMMKIISNYKTRLKNIREYFKSASLIDPNFDPEKNKYCRDSSKVISLVSYPPSQLGGGNAAIQTLSKYSFLYRELGFREVEPNNKSLSTSSPVLTSSFEDELLGLDDNGWWWNLGDANLSISKISKFYESSDSVILLSTKDDWNILNSSDNPKLNSFKALLKRNNSQNHHTSSNNLSKRLSYGDYHLWNEGLRSPIALNLVLDILVDALTSQFEIDLNQHENNGVNGDLKKKYQAALDWGDYWSNIFVSFS